MFHPANRATGGVDIIIVLQRHEIKVRNFQEMSVNVNEKESEEKEINDIHNRQ